MPKGSLCWDFRYRKNLSIVLFKNLITNSDNTLLIFLRQLFAIYKLAFSEISIEQHLREEMWMTPGEQRMQLSVLNLQSKGTLQWYFSAQCESRAQWIWEKTDNFYLHCAGLLNFSWIVGKEKVVVNKVHIKRPLYFSKVEREGILAILCLIGIFQILNVISQNTQGSVSEVYGHISLQNDALMAEGQERCLKLNGFTTTHQAALTSSILRFQPCLQCFLLKADLAKMLA